MTLALVRTLKYFWKPFQRFLINERRIKKIWRYNVNKIIHKNMAAHCLGYPR